MSDGTPLGSLLLDEGLLTEAQLDAAVAEQARSGKPLGRLLIEQGTISEAELVRTLARQVGLEFVDLNDRTIDGSVAALVTESLARRYQAIPGPRSFSIVNGSELIHFPSTMAGAAGALTAGIRMSVLMSPKDIGVSSGFKT